MDRKSRILIVSFFNYILVISHGKVGGKVGSVIKSLSPRFQTTIQVNGTQFNTSANQFQQSEFQDTCHLAWYTRILACPRPLPRLPSTTPVHSHLYHGPPDLCVPPVPAHDCDHDPLPPRWRHTRIPKVLAACNYSGLFAVGSSEILLVDRESVDSVQSGVLTQAIVGQLEQLPLLKMGINANDCGIVKWRETVGLQTPRKSRECMGSRHSPLSNPCKVPDAPTGR